jgi:hypothetical protein
LACAPAEATLEKIAETARVATIVAAIAKVSRVGTLFQPGLCCGRFVLSVMVIKLLQRAWLMGMGNVIQ